MAWQSPVHPGTRVPDLAAYAGPDGPDRSLDPLAKPNVVDTRCDSGCNLVA